MELDIQHEPVTLHEAARAGNIPQLVSLLQKQQGNLLQRSSTGATALHWAARYNQIEAIKVLLSAGFPINITDDQGQTALHTAVLLGHEGAVITLLEAGANHLLQNKHSQIARDMTRTPRMLSLLIEWDRKQRRLLSETHRMGELEESLNSSNGSTGSTGSHTPSATITSSSIPHSQSGKRRNEGTAEVYKKRREEVNEALRNASLRDSADIIPEGKR